MPADVNVYGLGVEFSLRTKQPMRALRTLGQSIADIEKQLGTLSTRWATVDVVRVSRGMAALTGEARRLLGQFQETGDIGFLKDYTAAAETLARNAEFLRASLHKLTPAQRTMVETQLKAVDPMIRTAKALQQQRQVGNALIDVLGDMELGSRSLKEAVIALTKKWGLLAAAGILVKEVLQDLISMQNQYAKVSFRAAGATSELISATMGLRGALGATGDEARATMVALSEAGIRAEEDIGKAARANFMFSHATGVSAKAVADYQKQIVTLTGSISDATEDLGIFASVMRKSGMSAAELEGAIVALNRQLLIMAARVDPEVMRKFGREFIKLAGWAKMAGGSVDAVTMAMTEMDINIERMYELMGLLNYQFDEQISRQENITKFMADGPKLWAEYTKGMEEQTKAVIASSFGIR